MTTESPAQAGNQDHREAMRSAMRRGGALAEAWCEAHAAGADTGPIDVAIADAVRDYRRAERKHRKALRRAESTESSACPGSPFGV